MLTQRARGAVFTPESVALRLAEVALEGRSDPSTVCDPAAGDGRLLRAVADAVAARRGVAPQLFGADLHEPPPGADLLWSRSDTLIHGLGAWGRHPADGFDLVIGNPPFRGQLLSETALSASERAALTDRYGEVALGYADTAAMFLVAACQMAAAEGRVALIMPLSFLATRDAAASRRQVLELATLEGIWIAPEGVFPDADVRVCALILDRSGPRRRQVRRWMGAEFERLEPIAVDSDELMSRPTWGHLAAAALGVPEVRIDPPRDGARLGTIVTATAGFRQQFYGLAPLVTEGPKALRTLGPNDATPGLAPLVTSGLIDPGCLLWGVRSARIAGTAWERPAVDLAGLDPTSDLARWVADRLRPKLLVATQTKVIEAAPDPDGTTIPSTPVIAVHGEGFDLWRALAVLLAPPVTAWGLSRYTGAALSLGAVKLSAAQVREIPLPDHHDPWNAAAALHARSHASGGIDHATLLEAGQLMSAAYGCDASITDWWAKRLPPSR